MTLIQWCSWWLSLKKVYWQKWLVSGIVFKGFFFSPRSGSVEQIWLVDKLLCLYTQAISKQTNIFAPNHHLPSLDVTMATAQQAKVGKGKPFSKLLCMMKEWNCDYENEEICFWVFSFKLVFKCLSAVWVLFLSLSIY